MDASSPPLFRVMAADDVGPVAALARAVWNAHYPGIITQAQIDYMLDQRYNADRLLAELTMPDVVWDLAFIDGRIVGFCSTVDLGADGEAPGGELKIDKLYVDTALQGRGIGGMLVARAASRAVARGRASLVLAVNKHNAKAIAAYRKHGFSVRESVRVDIGQGFVMDDFIMQRPVTATARP